VTTDSERKDYAKLVMLGVLHMAQYFPQAFTGVALPFIFRKEGLPIESFWLLALPQIPRWLKWLIALMVDNYGNPRIGMRKSWIIPCTLIGTLLYALLAFVPPTVATVYIVVAILLAKSFVMAAQDIAVDGYAAESMTDAERPVGTSIIVFLAIVAGVLGSGVVALVEAVGWFASMLSASLFMLAAATPAILRPEPPPPAASRERRERGERPSLVKALRRRDSWFILPFLFLFGFGGALFTSMIGPFLADKGLSLTQFGILAPVMAITGGGAGALATPLLIDRLGLKATALIGIALLPVEGAVFCAFALMDGLPPLPAFVVIVALLGFGTSIYTFAVNNSRFRWASKAQAGTDYSMQSSLWNFGLWAAGTVAGFMVGAFGWAVYFPLVGVLAAAFGALYVVYFDRIEALVRERETAELSDAEG